MEGISAVHINIQKRTGEMLVKEFGGFQGSMFKCQTELIFIYSPVSNDGIKIKHSIRRGKIFIYSYEYMLYRNKSIFLELHTLIHKYIYIYLYF